MVCFQLFSPILLQIQNKFNYTGANVLLPHLNSQDGFLERASSVRAALNICRTTFYDLRRHQRLPPMVTAGSTLRQMREKLGLTMRDVETASEKLARKRGNVGYFVPISRLSDVETKAITPSIYRLYALAIIYHTDFRHMLRLYGVELDLEVSDLVVSSPPKSYVSQAFSTAELAHLPVRMDARFYSRKTLNVGWFIV